MLLTERYWPRPAHRPLVCGHRGYSAVAADNSLDSFKRAYAVGADAVECDVRVTADGELFTHHDRQGADGRADVATITAAERKALGYCALNELLALRDSEQPAGRIFFDVKTIAAAAKLLADLPPRAEFLFGSFSDHACRLALDAGWGACLLDTYPDPFIIQDFLPPGARLGANFYQAGRLTDSELARSLVGTVDSAEIASYLAGRGAWVINTNDPHNIVKLFA